VTVDRGRSACDKNFLPVYAKVINKFDNIGNNLIYLEIFFFFGPQEGKE